MNNDQDRRLSRPAPLESFEFVIGILVLLGGWFSLCVAHNRYFITARQIEELALYFVFTVLCGGALLWWLFTGHSRRESEWPHRSLVISPRRDQRILRNAWKDNAVVLGYDIHGKPWLWPDRIRVMQGIALGMTGAGKSTLLTNIISQDLERVVGPPDDPHRIPMVILDGKGDLEYLQQLLPYIHRAGRLRQLRVLNPSRPDISTLYNPFRCTSDDYMAIVNMVFGSFDLHHEFFSPHQQNYLSNIVRVLVYTGQRFNFYDVMVMALDQEVIREQVERATREIERTPDLTLQRRLNFEMSVRSLYQSFQDRDRVQNIQGLLNKCMTFLDDELSVITGPYEDLLSIDDVIEQELILFVSLNINKNTEPIRALGKMLLQNLQLVVGKRYESEEERSRAHRPIFSVILDEFAPFGYRNFAQILQTARGTNTAFLFSLQSLSQLLEVGKGFKEDVSSAPNTTMLSLTRNEETARHFLRASSEQRVTRRSRSLQRTRWFGYEKYEETGRAVETDDRETRARDEHIKNLPTGQIEILKTDQSRGTLHGHLHVRPPADVRIPNFIPEQFPRLRHSLAGSVGANLRFKSAMPSPGARPARHHAGGF